MLIYEPKKYPSLNLKVGDTVYEWITGTEFGKVFDVTDYSIMVRENISKELCDFHASGLYYKVSDMFFWYDAESNGNDILMYYRITENKRIKC
jgi:hypothetical protein